MGYSWWSNGILQIEKESLSFLALAEQLFQGSQGLVYATANDIVTEQKALSKYPPNSQKPIDDAFPKD